MRLKRWCAFGPVRAYGFRALRFAEPLNDGGLEPHRARPLHLRDLLDAVQQLGRDRLVDRDEADRVAALAVAAEREGRDVDAGRPEERAEGADEAGLIGVADVDH